MTQRLEREDWVREAIKVLREHGTHGVKIVLLAKRLGVTSGSFYWHFKDLQDLLDSVLYHWEHEFTDAIIEKATTFEGTPAERVLSLMLQVVEEDAAGLDQAILIWARSNPSARKTFERTLGKRFEFARWMFKEAGFSDWDARVRGRLMVAYLMGESSTDLTKNKNWRAIVNDVVALMMS